MTTVLASNTTQRTTPSGAPPSAAAAQAGPPSARTLPLCPSMLPTATALALARAPLRELEQAFQRGTTPDIEALVGWDVRGINATPADALPLARLAGLQKFVKGMFRAEDGRVMGYNSPVVQNVLDGRWRTRPSDTAPKRFGFYEVAPVDPTARDNHYLHALLLDYRKATTRRGT